MTAFITPYMRRWAGARAAARPIRLPAGPPLSSEAGPDPDRVLLLGSGPASGLGVVEQEAALGGLLAHVLPGATGRGAVVESRAKPDLPVAGVHELLRGARLERFDAVVLFAGLHEALTWSPKRAWRREAAGLIDAVLDGSSTDTALIVPAIPRPGSLRTYAGWQGRLADHRAAALNRTLRSLAAARPRLLVLDLSQPSPTTPPAAWYVTWAAELAGALASRLAGAEGARTVRNAPQHEPDRLAALARSKVPVRQRDPRFDRIAARARDLLGADAGAVSFLDDEVQWFAALDGDETLIVPRAVSICSTITLQQDRPTVIHDLHADHGFDGNPMVHGQPPIRFYAGCPIESPEGFRIGTVCVFGREPRSESEVDVATLQELAAAARAEIWAGRPA